MQGLTARTGPLVQTCGERVRARARTIPACGERSGTWEAEFRTHAGTKAQTSVHALISKHARHITRRRWFPLRRDTDTTMVDPWLDVCIADSGSRGWRLALGSLNAVA